MVCHMTIFPYYLIMERLLFLLIHFNARKSGYTLIEANNVEWEVSFLSFCCLYSGEHESETGQEQIRYIKFCKKCNGTMMGSLIISSRKFLSLIGFIGWGLLVT